MMIAFSQTTSLTITAWATGLLVITGLGAIGFAVWQLGATRKQANLDRTVALHRDATTGEVQAAKRRLGTLLWAKGESLAGHRRVRYRPSFTEFFPAVKGVDRRGGAVGAYGADIASNRTAMRPLTDLYCILHSFERVHAARTQGALDESLFDSLAWDTCSWSMALEDIREEQTVHVVSLHQLARTAFLRLTPDERQRLRDLTFIDADRTKRTGYTPWDALGVPRVTRRAALKAAWSDARAKWKAVRP